MEEAQAVILVQVAAVQEPMVMPHPDPTVEVEVDLAATIEEVLAAALGSLDLAPVVVVAVMSPQESVVTAETAEPELPQVTVKVVQETPVQLPPLRLMELMVLYVYYGPVLLDLGPALESPINLKYMNKGTYKNGKYISHTSYF